MAERGDLSAGFPYFVAQVANDWASFGLGRAWVEGQRSAQRVDEFSWADGGRAFRWLWGVFVGYHHGTESPANYVAGLLERVAARPDKVAFREEMRANYRQRVADAAAAAAEQRRAHEGEHLT